MSLLREIQNTSIDSKTPITDLLRKCKVLAFRLGHDEFKTWIDNELNGYPSNDGLPEYRIFDVESRGDFRGMAAEIKSAHIPKGVIPEKYRHLIEKSYIIHPISTIVYLAKENKGGAPLHASWPADLIAIVGREIYPDMNCISAWTLMSKGQFIGIVDTVRNRILQFALEIESQAPDAGEAPANKFPVPQETVSQIFNTNIMGTIGKMTVINQTVSQTNIKVQTGDFASLREALKEVGFEDVDISLLESAIGQDKKKGEISIGEKTGAWIGKMLSKASSEALKIGSDVATKVLTKAISQYLGLPET